MFCLQLVEFAGHTMDEKKRSLVYYEQFQVHFVSRACI